jgi:MFS family permease
VLSTVFSIYSLLIAIAVLLLGSGLLGTLIGVRASIEGFSNTTTGIIMSAFFVGYIIGAYLCPRLIRDVGHIRAFSVLASIASAAMILHGLIIDPYVWWALRIISGICIVGLYMIVESWLNSLIKTHPKRGRIFSIYMMTTLVALGAGQFLLLLYGAMELASFALGAIFFTLALVPIAITRLSQPAQIQMPQMMLGKLIQAAPLGTASALCAGLISGSFWGLGALYAHNLGLEETGVALFVSTVILGGVVFQLPIGHFSDHRDRRNVIKYVSLLGGGVAFASYLVAPSSLVWLFVTAALYGGFSFSVYALAVAHTNDLIDPDEIMNSTRTLLLLNGIGAAIGPVTAGLLMQWLGNDALMLFFTLVLFLLAGFAFLRVHSATSPAVEEQEAFVPVTRTGMEAVEMDPRVNPEQDTTSPDNPGYQ